MICWILRSTKIPFWVRRLVHSQPTAPLYRTRWCCSSSLSSVYFLLFVKEGMATIKMISCRKGKKDMPGPRRRRRRRWIAFGLRSNFNCSVVNNRSGIFLRLHVGGKWKGFLFYGMKFEWICNDRYNFQYTKEIYFLFF